MKLVLSHRNSCPTKFPQHVDKWSRTIVVGQGTWLDMLFIAGCCSKKWIHYLQTRSDRVKCTGSIWNTNSLKHGFLYWWLSHFFPLACLHSRRPSHKTSQGKVSHTHLASSEWTARHSYIGPIWLGWLLATSFLESLLHVEPPAPLDEVLLLLPQKSTWTRPSCWKVTLQWQRVVLGPERQWAPSARPRTRCGHEGLSLSGSTRTSGKASPSQSSWTVRSKRSVKPTGRSRMAYLALNSGEFLPKTRRWSKETRVR